MSHGSGNDPSREETIRRLSTEAQPTVIRELWELMRHNKKWWLIPAIAVLLAAGLLLLLAGTGAAPFVYTLF